MVTYQVIAADLAARKATVDEQAPSQMGRGRRWQSREQIQNGRRGIAFDPVVYRCDGVLVHFKFLYRERRLFKRQGKTTPCLSRQSRQSLSFHQSATRITVAAPALEAQIWRCSSKAVIASRGVPLCSAAAAISWNVVVVCRSIASSSTPVFDGVWDTEHLSSFSNRVNRVTR